MTQYYPRPSATACYARAVKMGMTHYASWEQLAHRLEREALFYSAGGLQGMKMFCLDRARDCLYRAKWSPGHVDAFFGVKV